MKLLAGTLGHSRSPVVSLLFLLNFDWFLCEASRFLRSLDYLHFMTRESRKCHLRVFSQDLFSSNNGWKLAHVYSSSITPLDTKWGCFFFFLNSVSLRSLEQLSLGCPHCTPLLNVGHVTSLQSQCHFSISVSRFTFQASYLNFSPHFGLFDNKINLQPFSNFIHMFLYSFSTSS